jgi:hypothetical protein
MYNGVKCFVCGEATLAVTFCVLLWNHSETLQAENPFQTSIMKSVTKYAE